MSSENNKVLTIDGFNDVAWISIGDLDSDEHKIYDVKRKTFVNFWIKRSGKINRHIQIKADALQKNQPFEDIYLQSGNIVEHNGNVTKTIKLPINLRKRYKIDLQSIPIICTETGCWTDISGVPVLTWKLSSWKDF